MRWLHSAWWKAKESQHCSESIYGIGSQVVEQDDVDPLATKQVEVAPQVIGVSDLV
jgi:hypothetical protein